MKSKLSAIRRINRIIEFYHKRGVNKESVNKVYWNVLQIKLPRNR